MESIFIRVIKAVMYQLNLLLIYSNEKDRKELTAFLVENSFTVKGSFHSVDEIDSLHFYPDVAIIQTSIYAFVKTAEKIKERFLFVQTIYGSCSNSKAPRYGLSYEQLIEHLEKERLLKKQRLIKFIKQIQEKQFSRCITNKGINYYELQLM